MHRFLVFFFAGLFPALALGQSYPVKPISVISTQLAGSTVDVAYRATAAEASRILGQPMIFDYRQGAQFRLGVNAVKRAPADGYLLTIASDNLLVIQPINDPDFQLELGKDYSPVSYLFENPLALVANANVPFTDVKGLITYAKANPGKLNMAYSPATDFLTERFRQAAGIEVTLVPYKGAVQYMPDLTAGRIQVALTGPSSVPLVNSGKLIGIATTGRQRWVTYPRLPTFIESGLAVSASVWFGVIGPAGLPAQIPQTLNSAFNAALKVEEVQKHLEGHGYTVPPAASPAEFGAFIQSEIKAWTPVLRNSSIKPVKN